MDLPRYPRHLYHQDGTFERINELINNNEQHHINSIAPIITPFTQTGQNIKHDISNQLIHHTNSVKTVRASRQRVRRSRSNRTPSLQPVDDILVTRSLAGRHETERTCADDFNRSMHDPSRSSRSRWSAHQLADQSHDAGSALPIPNALPIALEEHDTSFTRDLVRSLNVQSRSAARDYVQRKQHEQERELAEFNEALLQFNQSLDASSAQSLFQSTNNSTATTNRVVFKQQQQQQQQTEIAELRRDIEPDSVSRISSAGGEIVLEALSRMSSARLSIALNEFVEHDFSRGTSAISQSSITTNAMMHTRSPSSISTYSTHSSIATHPEATSNVSPLIHHSNSSSITSDIIVSSSHPASGSCSRQSSISSLSSVLTSTSDDSTGPFSVKVAATAALTDYPFDWRSLSIASLNQFMPSIEHQQQSDIYSSITKFMHHILHALGVIHDVKSKIVRAFDAAVSEMNNEINGVQATDYSEPNDLNHFIDTAISIEPCITNSIESFMSPVHACADASKARSPISCLANHYARLRQYKFRNRDLQLIVTNLRHLILVLTLQSETTHQSNVRQQFKQSLILSLSSEEHESECVSCERFVVIFILLFALNRFPDADAGHLISDINESFFALVPVSEEERLTTQMQQDAHIMKMKQRDQRAMQMASLQVFHEQKRVKDEERKQARREKAQNILMCYPQLQRAMRIDANTGVVRFADHIPLILPPLPIPTILTPHR